MYFWQLALNETLRRIKKFWRFSLTAPPIETLFFRWVLLFGLRLRLVVLKGKHGKSQLALNEMFSKTKFWSYYFG